MSDDKKQGLPWPEQKLESLVLVFGESSCPSSYRAAPAVVTVPPTSTWVCPWFVAVARLTPNPLFIESGFSSSTTGEFSVKSSKRDHEQADAPSVPPKSSASRGRKARIRTSLPRTSRRQYSTR